MKRSDGSTLAVVVSHGIMHSYLVVLPALMPLMAAELGNLTFLAYVASLVTFFYGWGSLPAGLLADVSSKKRLMMLSMLLCGAAALVVSWAPDLTWAAAGMLLVGVGASLYHPPGYGHMALLSSEMRGRFMGIQGIGGDMGMAVAYAASAALGVGVGWRNTFLIWGAVGLATALADHFLMDDVPTEPEDRSVPRGGYLHAVRGMFTPGNRVNLLLVLSVVMLSGALWSGVSQWILTYINRSKGVSLLIAGGLSTVQYTVGAFGQIVGGELSDRWGRRSILLGGFAAFSASLAALVYAPGDLVLMLGIVVLLGFTFYVTQAPLSALLADITPKNTVGMTYGVNFAVKYGFGSIPPMVAAWLSQSMGLDYVFWFFAALSAAALLLTIPVKEKAKKR